MLGYSTGALAPGDAPRAIALLRGHGARAIELSALRLGELEPLLAALPGLDLSGFDHISVHAPSRFGADDEPRLIERLAAALPASWPIVLHPDAIHDARRWRALGPRVCLENMDKRKPKGRTASELAGFFEALPEASFCFDVGHAHQIDRTMIEAFELLHTLGARLGQLHVSEVSTAGGHEPLCRSAVAAFRKVAAWVPEHVPLILESPASRGIDAELALAAEAFARPRPAPT